jgi:hypothetical protein
MAVPAADRRHLKNGAPWTIRITPGPTQYLYSADAMSGRVYKLSLDRQVLGVLGREGAETAAASGQGEHVY